VHGVELHGGPRCDERVRHVGLTLDHDVDERVRRVRVRTESIEQHEREVGPRHAKRIGPGKRRVEDRRAEHGLLVEQAEEHATFHPSRGSELAAQQLHRRLDARVVVGRDHARQDACIRQRSPRAHDRPGDPQRARLEGARHAHALVERHRGGVVAANIETP